MEPDANVATGLLSIILADLVLSGDNALVIGMAVQRLPGAIKRRAIVLGTAGAVVLRILFTLSAALLLRVPLLGALGGVALLYIGYQLLAESGDEPDTAAEAREDFLAAVRTIIVADAVMSLDNALAVAAAARGHLGLLLIGLALSIPLLMLGANVVSTIFHRFPWLLYLGAAVIGWAGADLITHDGVLREWFPVLEAPGAHTIAVIAAIAVVVAAGAFGQARARERDAREAAEREAAG